MFITPRSLSEETLSPEILKNDRRQAAAFESCGIGKLAVYIDWFGISRMRYIPLEKVDRVFKRLAVTKGFFEQGKIYGSIPYLVIQCKGREWTAKFNSEDQLNAMLDYFKTNTRIPVGKLKT